jgi:hypothetical protein
VFVVAQIFVLAFGVRGFSQHFHTNNLGNAWIVAGLGLATAAVWPVRTLPAAWGDWGARGILVLSLLPWILLGLAFGGTASDALNLFATGTSWVTQILAALLLIQVAHRSSSALWVNLGFLALAAGILTRYFDLFGDYLQGGAALALTGALVLVVLASLERARRRTLGDSSAGRLAEAGGRE